MTKNTQILSMDHFSNLRSFKYKSSRLITDDNFIIILGRLLAKCPNMSTLEIKTTENSQLRFHHLLAYISPIQQPLPLEHLCLSGLSICVADIHSILPHIKGLKILELYGNSSIVSTGVPAHSPNGEIWLALRQAAIFVMYLTTDIVDETFIAYISSFRGLRKLKLMHNTLNDPHQPSTNLIFNSILVMHCQSLIKVDFENRRDVTWPLDERYCDILIGCHRLRRLSISMIYNNQNHMVNFLS